MNLPKTVKIGYRKIKVTPYEFDDPQQQGSYHDNKSEMRIDENLVAPTKAEAFMHETLHGIMKIFMTGLAEREEERLICILSPALVQFIVDNPKAIIEIQKACE